VAWLIFATKQQILQLGSKFHGPQKTMVRNDQYMWLRCCHCWIWGPRLDTVLCCHTVSPLGVRGNVCLNDELAIFNRNTVPEVTEQVKLTTYTITVTNFW